MDSGSSRLKFCRQLSCFVKLLMHRDGVEKTELRLLMRSMPVSKQRCPIPTL